MRKISSSEFIKLILIAISVNVLIFLLNKSIVEYYSNTVEVLIVKCLGTLGNSMTEALINIPTITLNVAILMYKYSDYLSREIKVNGIYIFTRTNKRKKWILDRCLEVIRNVIIYYFIVISLYIFLALLSGFQFTNLHNLISIIIYQYFILVLITLFNIVIINFISIKFSAINSFSMIYSIYISNLVGVFFFKETLIGKLLGITPFGLSITAWNKSINKILDNNIEWFSNNVINYNIIYLVIYLITLIILIIILQRNLVKNMDIL